MVIEDGKGSGIKAEVSSDNRLKVNSASEKQIANISKTNERSFSWTAVAADIDTGDTALLVANTSTSMDLHITKIYMWADTAIQFKIHCPAYPTLAGTVVTGNNLNRNSNLIAEASAYADETGNTFAAGNVVLTMRNNEVGTDQFGCETDFEGALVLGYHNSVAVDLIGETGAFECTIFGYFE